jgi:hypothetical protein
MSSLTIKPTIPIDPELSQLDPVLVRLVLSVSAQVAAQVSAEIAQSVTQKLCADIISGSFKLLSAHFEARLAQLQPQVSISLPPMTPTINTPAITVSLPDDSGLIEETEITERNLDGSLKKAVKTKTRAKGVKA